jgi:hypothetical protein
MTTTTDTPLSCPPSAVRGLKALTVRNPWGWSIGLAPLPLRKPVENRSRYMAYRGPLAIHAGARSRWDPAGEWSHLVRSAWEVHVRSLPGWPGLPASDVDLTRKTTLMPFGAIIALAEVTGCHHSDHCMDTAGTYACSEWAAPGQFHITLANVCPLAEPVPARGMLGLWTVPEEAERAVRAQLGETDGR